MGQAQHPSPTRLVILLFSWQQPGNQCNNTALPNIKLTSAELKTSGKRKLSNAHSSWRLFCKGVPVSSNRFVVLNSRTISDSWKHNIVINIIYTKAHWISFWNLKQWQLNLETVSYYEIHIYHPIAYCFYFKKTPHVTLKVCSNQMQPFCIKPTSNIKQFQIYLRLLILYSVGFIDYQIPPVKFLEDWFLFNYHFIWCNTNIPFPRHHNITDKCSLKQKNWINKHFKHE